MTELTVTRTLKAPRERVWQVLTQASHFEGWLPANPRTERQHGHRLRLRRR